MLLWELTLWLKERLKAEMKRAGAIRKMKNRICSWVLAKQKDMQKDSASSL